eukprot:3733277-Amphidinium_carterae.4
MRAEDEEDRDVQEAMARSLADNPHDAEEEADMQEALRQSRSPHDLVPRAPHLRHEQPLDPTAASSATRPLAGPMAAPPPDVPRVIPTATREREENVAVRANRRSYAEGTAQTDMSGGQLDWRFYDTNKAVRLLHSPNQQTRLATLRRLHVRWYHCSREQLERILRASGVQGPALEELSIITSTRAVCRSWDSPTARSMTTTRTITDFNSLVQMDVMYYTPQQQEQLMIVHFIDAATRYSQAFVLSNRTEQCLCNAIADKWITIFGCPKIIESDSETGLVGQYAANFAEAAGFQWTHRPPRAKAAIVERHHEILRQSLHKTELQMQHEHRELEFSHVLALVIAAKNNLTVITGVTPHQAVFGRPGHLLPNTEEPTVSSDLSTVNRIREVAAASIVEEHAKQRMTRALRHQTRPAIEEFPYEPGAAVDFYTPQVGKETPTWRGRAQVISVQPGSVTLRWQSRTMERRTQEVRVRQTTHRSFVPLCRHTHACHLDRGPPIHRADVDSTDYQGRALYEKLQYLVNAIGISNPTAFRITTGCKSAAQLLEYLQCTVWAWQHGIDNILAEYSMETHGDQRIRLPLHTWAQQLSARSNASWGDILFLQIWHTPSESPPSTITTAPSPPTTQPQPAPPPATEAVPCEVTADDHHSMPTGSSVSTPSSRSMRSKTSGSQVSVTPSVPPPSQPPHPPQPPATAVTSATCWQPPIQQQAPQDSTPRSRSKYSSSTSRSIMSTVSVASSPGQPPHPPQPPSAAAVTSMTGVQPPLQQITQQDIMDAFDIPPLPPQPPGVDIELLLRSITRALQQSLLDGDSDDDDDEQPSRAAASTGATKRQKSDKGANKRQKTERDNEHDDEFLWMTCRELDYLTLILKNDAIGTPLPICESSSVYSACCVGQQCTVVDTGSTNHGDACIAFCFLDGCFGIPQLASTYGCEWPTGDMLEVTWPTGKDAARHMTAWCTETLSDQRNPVKCMGYGGEPQYLAAVKNL